MTNHDGRAVEDMERAASEAEAAEFFATPPAAIDELILCGPHLPGGLWVDAGAGTGRICRTINRLRSDIEWVLVELREECRPALETVERVHALVFGDFLAGEWRAACPVPPAVVIMNSPFTLTVPFIEEAWAASSSAWVASLQRQSFRGPKRGPWLREHAPDTYGLSFRPTFRRDRQSDSCEYEWHIWPPGARQRRSGHWEIMAPAAAVRQLGLFNEGVGV